MWLSEIAKIFGGRLLGDDKEISGMKPLFYAKSIDLAFIMWPKDIGLAQKSEAGCLVAELDVVADFADRFSCSLIAVDNLLTTFLHLAALVEQGAFTQNPPISRSIAVDSSVHKTAIIGNAHIGAKTIIEAGAVIHDGVFIGDGCRIGANSVIGSAGFVPYGINPSVHVPCLGGVIIDDFVHIGALCTVDKGVIGNTHIKKNTLMDNMVHVGHDVVIGENVIIAGQSGFAGFVRVGDHVTIGGQVGVAPHTVIGEGARISGKSMVHCDIKPHEIWSGNPSVPHSIYLRAYGRLMNAGKKHISGRP